MRNTYLKEMLFIIFIICIFVVAIYYSVTATKPIVQQAADLSGNAHEFPNGLKWLNTDQPIEIKTLKGKFVLLNFTDYRSIETLEIIPEIKELYEEYPEPLIVIDVYSPQIDTRESMDQIRESLLNYNIINPVVIDLNRKIYKQYHARGLPTFILIDPRGDVLFSKKGGGVYAAIKNELNRFLPEFHMVLNKKKIDFTSTIPTIKNEIDEKTITEPIAEPIQETNAKSIEEPIVFAFNFDSFTGHQIIVDEPIFSNVNNFNLTLKFPDNHKLLPNAKPYIRLFTDPNKIISEHQIKDNVTNIELNHPIDAPQLFAEVGIFYCRLGKEALCMFDNVLYELTVLSNGESKDINLEYVIQPEF